MAEAEKFIFESGAGERIESASLMLEGADDERVRSWETLRVTRGDGTVVYQRPAVAAKAFSGGFNGGSDVVDAEAKTRIEGQQAALRAAGIAVDAAHQVAGSGTRMMEVGYETQAARKHEHDRKLAVKDAAEALIETVRAEKRRAVTLSARELAEAIEVNGKIAVKDGSDHYVLGEQAIRGICGRLESPALRYLLGARDRMVENVRGIQEARGVLQDQMVKPEVRADAELAIARARSENEGDRRMMGSVLKYELRRRPETKLMLRLREDPKDVFACLSPGYGFADVPDVLPSVLAAVHQDARATWAYDEVSTTWELRASVWTPTPTADQAIGEPFEGWSSFSSRDNGTASLRGGGGVTLIRCYNASTYEARDNEVSRIHRKGILLDLGKLAAGALRAIDVICEAWGRARAAEIELPSKVTIEDAIPGFWRYCLGDTRQLAGVLPGRKKDHAEGLTAAFFSERRSKDRIVRADFAQGWTRYIQDQPSDVRREAERAIGRWLVDARPLRCEVEEAVS